MYCKRDETYTVITKENYLVVISRSKDYYF